MTKETAESIAHPIAFGTAMLVMFINWMVIGRSDGSWWMWFEHLAADLFVVALMVAVAESTSRVRSGWWSSLSRRPRSVSSAAQRVRVEVDEVERPHRAAAHVAGFFAAAGAFGVVGDETDRPLLMLGAVLGAFVIAQVVVMTLLRPRAESALRRALDTARAGLSPPEQSALCEELGLEADGFTR